MKIPRVLSESWKFIQFWKIIGIIVIILIYRKTPQNSSEIIRSGKKGRKSCINGKIMKMAQIHEIYLKLWESWRIMEFREKTSKRGRIVQIHRKCKNRRNFSKSGRIWQKSWKVSSYNFSIFVRNLHVWPPILGELNS